MVGPSKVGPRSAHRPKFQKPNLPRKALNSRLPRPPVPTLSNLPIRPRARGHRSPVAQSEEPHFAPDLATMPVREFDLFGLVVEEAYVNPYLNLVSIPSSHNVR